MDMPKYAFKVQNKFVFNTDECFKEIWHTSFLFALIYFDVPGKMYTIQYSVLLFSIIELDPSGWPI